MIVALCPLDNAFDTATNIESIDRQLRAAAAGGASLAVFPECGLTGFKARSDLSHAHLDAARAELQRRVARHGVAALVPSIELDRAGRPRNRARLLDADGVPRGCFEKVGLTRPEATWFAASDTPRARTFALGGLRFGVLFCIEFKEPPARYIDSRVDAVLWPSYLGHAEPFDWSSSGPHDGNATMRALARAWDAPLLLANHRRPDADAPIGDQVVIGGSLAVAPDGSLLQPLEPHRREPLFVRVGRD